MPAKTLVVHLPLKSSKTGSPNGFSTINTTSAGNLKSPTTAATFTTPETPDRKHTTMLRRRSDRRVKALSVGHISPLLPHGLSYEQSSTEVGEGGRRSRSGSGGGNGSIDEKFHSSGTAPHQKQSYISRVASGLTLGSRLKGAKDGKDTHGGGSSSSNSTLQLKSLGLGLGAGILFAGGDGEGRIRSRSRSKSTSRSRPGTAGGLISTASSSSNKTSLNVDKPLPSCPVSASHHHKHHHKRYSLALCTGGSQSLTPFGTQGTYSLLFVDHHLPLTAPSITSSVTRTRSTSTSAAGTPVATRPPSVNGVSLKLEPIIPVHVLEEMVSSPKEMDPGEVSAVVREYYSSVGARTPGVSGGSGGSGSSGDVRQQVQRRGSSRSRSRRSGSTMDMYPGGDLAPRSNASTPVHMLQETETGIYEYRARSLSRSGSTTVRSYARRPSKSSSLRREMRAESPTVIGERSSSTRPGTSASTYTYTCGVSRNNSTISRRRVDSDEEDFVEEEEERRGRGRSPGGYGYGSKVARRLNSVDRLALDDNLTRISENTPEKESLAEIREITITKRFAAPARKPVPVQVPAVASRPGQRKSSLSRSSSRSRSRSKSSMSVSRPTSPDCIMTSTGAGTMNTITEVQVSPIATAATRIVHMDRRAKSRTPSPLRPVVVDYTHSAIPRATASTSSLWAKYRADELQQSPSTSTMSPTSMQHTPPGTVRSPILPGMPKRKPVPQGSSPTSPAPPQQLPQLQPQPQSTLPSSTPSHLHLHRPKPNPKNPMIVAIPPPLGRTNGESPVSGGGKSTAGLTCMSSEDEEDPARTPGTGTFSYLTPLLPSPPKRNSPSPSPSSGPGPGPSPGAHPEMVSEEESGVCGGERGGRGGDVDVEFGVGVNVSGNIIFPLTPPRSSFTPPVGGMQMQNLNMHGVPPSPFSPQIDEVNSGDSASSSSPISLDSTPHGELSPSPSPLAQVHVQVQVHEPPAEFASIFANNDTISAQAPPASTPHDCLQSTPPSQPETPTPSSPVSVSHHHPTIPTASDLPTQLTTERSAWLTERQSLHTTLTTLSEENKKLRELVYKLTETVERQDMELRKQQQVQRRSGSGGSSSGGQIPKPLPLSKGGAAGVRMPQGWSVFTNPRTPPAPKPKSKLKASESAVPVEYKEVGNVTNNSVCHRRGSISLSVGSSTLLTAISSSSTPQSQQSPLPPRQALKKGSSDSFPSLQSIHLTKPSPVVLGLSMSTAVPTFASPSAERDPGGRSPRNQSNVEKVAGIAAPAAGRSPKAKALWKKTTAVAVAVGRKARVEEGRKP